MTSRHAEEVVTGIWCWERRPRGLRPGEFGGRTSYAVAIENHMLLLDPLVDGDDDPVLEMLDDLVRGGVRILVTMPYHTRSSESLWRRYRSAKATDLRAPSRRYTARRRLRLHGRRRRERSRRHRPLPLDRQTAPFAAADRDPSRPRPRLRRCNRRDRRWRATNVGGPAGRRPQPAMVERGLSANPRPAGQPRHRARPRNTRSACHRRRQGGFAARTPERPVAAPEASSQPDSTRRVALNRRRSLS